MFSKQTKTTELVRNRFAKLIFQESIVMQATLPIVLVSLIQKIHDHTLGLMIQPFPEF